MKYYNIFIINLFYFIKIYYNKCDINIYYNKYYNKNTRNYNKNFERIINL